MCAWRSNFADAVAPGMGIFAARGEHIWLRGDILDVAQDAQP
jgi:hypothetical protein